MKFNMKHCRAIEVISNGSLHRFAILFGNTSVDGEVQNFRCK